MTQRDVNYLQQLTSLPTAAACEDHVIGWIEQWVQRLGAQRAKLRRDRFGNLLIERVLPAGARRSRSPIVIEAHLDHPAFVVTSVNADGTLAAEFRGGVDRAYLTTSPVRIVPRQGETVTARVVEVADKPATAWSRFDVQLIGDAPATHVQPGDLAVWDLPTTSFEDGLAHAPVCDDLAAVAAAVSAWEKWLGRNADAPNAADVRLLFTRAEEVGFVGTLGVAINRWLPDASRIITLENSRSFAESPIGGGPIIRVGDRTSIFDSDLTYRINYLADQLAKRSARTKKPFLFQRKLMPGGTCEATAYAALNYAAACICLPLGHYHNMNEQQQCIDREHISLDDYHGLVRLLGELMDRLDVDDEQADLVARLKTLWADRATLLSD